MSFARFRRIRSNAKLRRLVSESFISKSDLILPIFVEEDIKEIIPIDQMPGVYRVPESMLSERVKEVEATGVEAIILFGVSHHKDEIGSDTFSKDGLVARMTRIAREASNNMAIITDVCFCEYTSHGHCGPVIGNDVDNDLSIENLGKQAVIAANAGADMIAPSAMMDGQVYAIRKALDSSGHHQIPIMSYSSKFSSALYGPFRMAGGTSLKGTRESYMLDQGNIREAIRESLEDEDQGADILMVKPGIHYLDVVCKVREASSLPLCAYHVSGEYAMLKFAAQNGAIDEDKVLMETMKSFKRAGADLIITYYAERVINLLNNQPS